VIVGVRDDFAARIVLASIKSSIRARSVGTGISSNSRPELGAAWTRSPGRERAVAWVRLLDPIVAARAGSRPTRLPLALGTGATILSWKCVSPSLRDVESRQRAARSSRRGPLTNWAGRIGSSARSVLRSPPTEDPSLRSSPAPCGSGMRRSRRSRTPRRASAPRPDSGDCWPRLGPCTAAHSNTSPSPLSSRLSRSSRPVWAARAKLPPGCPRNRPCVLLERSPKFCSPRGT
jgi:hypothetical protein